VRKRGQRKGRGIRRGTGSGDERRGEERRGKERTQEERKREEMRGDRDKP
jgi:hypothetical protein